MPLLSRSNHLLSHVHRLPTLGALGPATKTTSHRSQLAGSKTAGEFSHIHVLNLYMALTQNPFSATLTLLPRLLSLRYTCTCSAASSLTSAEDASELERGRERELLLLPAVRGDPSSRFYSPASSSSPVSWVVSFSDFIESCTGWEEGNGGAGGKDGGREGRRRRRR